MNIPQIITNLWLISRVMKMLVLIIFSSVIIAFIEEWIFRGLYSAKNTYASESIIIQEWGFENLSAWIHSWVLGMSLECRQTSRLLLPPGWAGTQAPVEALWGSTFCVSLGFPWGEGGQEACLLSLQLWERRHTAQKRSPSSDAGQGGSCVARKPCLSSSPLFPKERELSQSLLLSWAPLNCRCTQAKVR